MINQTKNKFFFFATSSDLKEVRKEFKKIFFFFPISEVKKFRSKNQKFGDLLNKKWHFLNNGASVDKIHNFVNFSNIFMKKTFLIFIWFFESKIFQKKNIFYIFSNYFFPNFFFKMALFFFFDFRFSRNQTILRLLNKHNLFILSEIFYLF